VNKLGTEGICNTKIINIYYFIVVCYSIFMFNPDYVTKAERERRIKYKRKPTRTAKTISVESSVWALLDLIKVAKNFKNANETVAYCITEIGVAEGIETV